MNYHTITYPDQNNGDGLRVVLWLSGCSHHCYNCQNPQTWNAENGILFDRTAKEELFKELSKDYISGLTLSGGDPLNTANLDDVLNLVREINKQYDVPQYVVDRIKYNHNILDENTDKSHLLLPRKTIWLYTGYKWEDLFNGAAYTSKEHDGLKRRNIIKQCDVLVDGEYIDSQRDINLKWRGSSNQRVIDVQKSLYKGEVVLWCT